MRRIEPKPEFTPLNRQQPATQRRTTRDLTDAHRRLVQIMSDCQFGRIENLPVYAGQPVLDPGVKVVRVARLGGESGGATVPCTDEFELKQAVCHLFDELARLKNGTVVRLDFKRGLPCRVETTTTAVPGNQPTTYEAAKSGPPTDHSPNPNRGSSD
jgi:hypothetical protein